MCVFAKRKKCRKNNNLIENCVQSESSKNKRQKSVLIPNPYETCNSIPSSSFENQNVNFPVQLFRTQTDIARGVKASSVYHSYTAYSGRHNSASPVSRVPCSDGACLSRSAFRPSGLRILLIAHNIAGSAHGVYSYCFFCFVFFFLFLCSPTLASPTG